MNYTTQTGCLFIKRAFILSMTTVCSLKYKCGIYQQTWYSVNMWVMDHIHHNPLGWINGLLFIQHPFSPHSPDPSHVWELCDAFNLLPVYESQILKIKCKTHQRVTVNKHCILKSKDLLTYHDLRSDWYDASCRCGIWEILKSTVHQFPWQPEGCMISPITVYWVKICW